MHTITVTDPTNSGFVYMCDWVAATSRGYDQEDHECENFRSLLEFIKNDDESWDFQPRLRIRRMPADYAGNIRAARNDNWFEEVYWTPGTPTEFKSDSTWQQNFIVPEQFVIEVGEV